MSTMKRHSSSLMPGVEVPGNCTTGLRMESPTQVTRVSRWPNPSSTCCATRSMSAALVASPVRARACRPRACTSSATRLTPAGVRALTATSAPASAKARAMPLPMPRPPPTIKTFCPVMSNAGMLIILSLVLCNDHCGGDLTDTMLLVVEADAVARVRPRWLLCRLDYLAAGDASRRGRTGKPGFGETVDDGLRARLHEGAAILPHCGELLDVGDLALQPPAGELHPAHSGAALEAGGKLA